MVPLETQNVMACTFTYDDRTNFVAMRSNSNFVNCTEILNLFTYIPMDEMASIYKHIDSYESVKETANYRTCACRDDLLRTVEIMGLRASQKHIFYRICLTYHSCTELSIDFVIKYSVADEIVVFQFDSHPDSKKIFTVVWYIHI